MIDLERRNPMERQEVEAAWDRYIVWTRMNKKRCEVHRTPEECRADNRECNFDHREERDDGWSVK